MRKIKRMDLDGRVDGKKLERVEEGNHNQNILCDKIIFFNIKNKSLSCVDYTNSPIYLNYKTE